MSPHHAVVRGGGRCGAGRGRRVGMGEKGAKGVVLPVPYSTRSGVRGSGRCSVYTDLYLSLSPAGGKDIIAFRHYKCLSFMIYRFVQD